MLLCNICVNREGFCSDRRGVNKESSIKCIFMDADKEKICSDCVIDAIEYFVYLVLRGRGHWGKI